MKDTTIENIVIALCAAICLGAVVCITKEKQDTYTDNDQPEVAEWAE